VIADIRDIRRHSFTASDRLLLDANVWLSVYGPADMQDTRTSIYSAALRRMLDAKSQVFLDAFILSEFVNRFAHFEYDRARIGGEATDFKSFRDSPAFEDVAAEIAISATKILNMSIRCQWAFISANVGNLLADFARTRSDFNDLVLASVCREEGLTLVTHDADFKWAGFPILTAHPRLLR
jgi:predicted nucleic acid-binding protein